MTVSEDEALAMASASEESDQGQDASTDYWSHPSSRVYGFTHKGSLGAVAFSCGRPLQDSYKRAPVVKLASHPLCAKCFPEG